MMKNEIAIVTTEFLRDFIVRSMKESRTDVDYTIYPYQSFQDLAGIYESIPKRVKGIVTSGSFPAQVLRSSFPDSRRIIRPFNNDDAGIYRLFLQLLNENRGLNVSRIYADILVAAGIDTASYLFGEQEENYADLLDAKVAQMSMDELMRSEKKHADMHLELWRSGHIDVSVTRFSSIVTQLRDAGLPVHFAYPSMTYLGNVCREALHEIQIAELHDNQTAAILVTLSNDGKPDESVCEQRLRLLSQALRRFDTVRQLDYLIRPVPQGFEILTDRKAVESITGHFKSCQLQDFLRERLDFGFSIGYGIGAELYQARTNAVVANHEAARYREGSCLVNERDELIAPLKSDVRLVIPREVSDQVREVAGRTGLSYITVQKVFAAVHDNEENRITSQKLAHKLAITTRSANRFLSALSEAGYATVLERNQSMTKGRPVRVYQVDFMGHQAAETHEE